MDLSAAGAIAVQTAQTRQNAALSFVKNNADTQAQIANVLSSAAQQGEALASSGRGSIVNISA